MVLLLRWFSRAVPPPCQLLLRGFGPGWRSPFLARRRSHESAQMVLTAARDLWELPSYFGAGNGREEATAPRGGTVMQYSWLSKSLGFLIGWLVGLCFEEQGGELPVRRGIGSQLGARA